jgi:hypothetical protein
MVFVSIHPFASKKIVLLVAALLCLSSALCLADPLFMSVSFNSHRHQIPPPTPTPASISNDAVRPPSLPVVARDMESFLASPLEYWTAPAGPDAVTLVDSASIVFPHFWASPGSSR